MAGAYPTPGTHGARPLLRAGGARVTRAPRACSGRHRQPLFDTTGGSTTASRRGRHERMPEGRVFELGARRPRQKLWKRCFGLLLPARAEFDGQIWQAEERHDCAALPRLLILVQMDLSRPETANRNLDAGLSSRGAPAAAEGKIWECLTWRRKTRRLAW